MADQGPLAEKLRHAGATFGMRHGRPTALHFGSATSELAVCQAAVGLLHRSDLDVHLANGNSTLIDQLTEVELGHPLAAGELAVLGRTCWGRATPEEAIVVCDAEVSPRLDRQLQTWIRRCAGLELQDSSNAPVAIGVIGHATISLLGRLGATASPPLATRPGSMLRCTLHGVEVRWMLLAAEFSLALVPCEQAIIAWEAIERGGRGLGLIYVGVEACERFSAGLMATTGRHGRQAGRS